MSVLRVIAQMWEAEDPRVKAHYRRRATARRNQRNEPYPSHLCMSCLDSTEGKEGSRNRSKKTKSKKNDPPPNPSPVRTDQCSSNEAVEQYPSKSSQVASGSGGRRVELTGDGYFESVLVRDALADPVDVEVGHIERFDLTTNPLPFAGDTTQISGAGLPAFELDATYDILLADFMEADPSFDFIPPSQPSRPFGSW